MYHDSDEIERRDKDRSERFRKESEEILQKALDDDFRDCERTLAEDLAFDEPAPAPAKKADKAQKPKTKPVGTIAARSAASALAKPSKPSSGPSYAAPTAAARAKAPSGGLLGRKARPTPAAPLASKQSLAPAISHSTLGYAKGRAVSNTLRKPLAGVFQDQTQVIAPKKDPIKELEEIVRAREYEEMGIDDDEDVFGGGGVSLLEDEDYADFQMKIPEE